MHGRKFHNLVTMIDRKAIQQHDERVRALPLNRRERRR
jgi:hypothetical protein